MLILERGMIPSGASSRNAGFACFGSFTELMADTEKQGENEMLELVEMRFKGLEKIRKKFSKKKLITKILADMNWFHRKNSRTQEHCAHNIDKLNRQLKEITGKQKTFQLNDSKIKSFGLGGSHHLIENKLEGQLHSGKLLEASFSWSVPLGVTILTQVDVKKMENRSDSVFLETNLPVPLNCRTGHGLHQCICKVTLTRSGHRSRPRTDTAYRPDYGSEIKRHFSL